MDFNQTRYLLHTIKHLKPIQIAYRARSIAFAKLTAVASLRNESVPAEPNWRPLTSISNFRNRSWISADEIERNEFAFLNQVSNFDNRLDWRVPGQSRLWRYNLHYFDYLFPDQDLNPLSAGRLMHSWLDCNPPGTPDAWAPFPISLRLVNWVKFISFFDTSWIKKEKILQSAYEQALWLERHLEYHLLANHLLKNAKALIFVGLFFKGEDAERWLRKGIEIYTKQLDEQILPDGGHFERSPMYHSMILEDCLDLLNVCQDHTDQKVHELAQQLRIISHKMGEFLLGMTHSDGDIALFNDAAFGIEVLPEDLKTYYEQLTGEKLNTSDSTMWAFPQTGYFIMAPQQENRMIIDCGPIGPDYQPGHSHCDTLSFELSLQGQRVVVDSGCFQYEDSPIRQYNRGNAGHNTVTIDGENQSEVWASHRCARRAYPLYARLEKGLNNELLFEGAHDGYKRLSGRPIHHRKIVWLDKLCTIEDRIEGHGHHDLETRLHINPELDLEFDDKKATVSYKENTLLTICTNREGRLEKISGWYCPEFGKKLSCAVLIQKHKSVSLPFRCGWEFKIHNDS